MLSFLPNITVLVVSSVRKSTFFYFNYHILGSPSLFKKILSSKSFETKGQISKYHSLSPPICIVFLTIFLIITFWVHQVYLKNTEKSLESNGQISKYHLLLSLPSFIVFLIIQ